MAFIGVDIWNLGFTVLHYSGRNLVPSKRHTQNKRFRSIWSKSVLYLSLISDQIGFLLFGDTYFIAYITECHLWSIFTHLLGVWKSNFTPFRGFDILGNTAQFQWISFHLAAINWTTGRVFACSSGVKLLPRCFCYLQRAEELRKIKNCIQCVSQTYYFLLRSSQVRHE